MLDKLSDQLGVRQAQEVKTLILVAECAQDLLVTVLESLHHMKLFRRI